MRKEEGDVEKTVGVARKCKEVKKKLGRELGNCKDILEKRFRDNEESVSVRK